MTVIHADCLDAMAAMDADSVDAIVCDPPYGLSFMGKQWDHGVPGVPFWTEALRVAKPGAHLVAFGGTRTYHRLACAIEDAGWEIRDCLSWNFGSGFPKSHDVSKAMDKMAGAEREKIGSYRRGMAMHPGNEGVDNWRENYTGEVDITAPATDLARQWQGWGTALKPAWEPIILARKPLIGTVAANVAAHGTGALNVDGCRIEGAPPSVPQPKFNSPTGAVYGFKAGEGRNGEMSTASGRWPANVCLDEWQEDVLYLRDSVPVEIAHLISEFYSGYNRVPPMREESFGVPEQGGSLEVLQSGVLVALDVGERAGGFAPDGRTQTLRGVSGKDAEQEKGDGVARPEQPELEGWSVREFERVRSGNGAEQPQGEAGTPSRDGGCVGEAARPEGSRASSERDQTRQQAGELGVDGQPDTQAGTQRHRAGASRIAGGERTLAVLARDVPAGWHQYFRVGGSVRSPDCAAGMLDAQTGHLHGNGTTRNGATSIFGSGKSEPNQRAGDANGGGASRFFYTAKASRREREAGLEGVEKKVATVGDAFRNLSDPRMEREQERRPAANHHPTVKPIALMRWLCRLVTPPNGLVLDPFTGSGTTGCAAVLEGFRFVGIEREAEYVTIAEKRIAHWAGQRAEPDLFTEAE